IQAATMDADEALPAARQQQAASQSQPVTDVKGAPAGANAALLPPAAERPGDQRGRTASPSTAQAPAGTAAKADPNTTAPAMLQSDAVESPPAKTADKDIARFIPAREQWTQGNNQPKSPPQVNTGDALNGPVK